MAGCNYQDVLPTLPVSALHSIIDSYIPLCSLCQDRVGCTQDTYCFDGCTCCPGQLAFCSGCGYQFCKKLCLLQCPCCTKLFCKRYCMKKCHAYDVPTHYMFQHDCNQPMGQQAIRQSRTKWRKEQEIEVGRKRTLRYRPKITYRSKKKCNVCRGTSICRQCKKSICSSHMSTCCGLVCGYCAHRCDDDSCFNVIICPFCCSKCSTCDKFLCRSHKDTSGQHPQCSDCAAKCACCGKVGKKKDECELCTQDVCYSLCLVSCISCNCFLCIDCLANQEDGPDLYQCRSCFIPHN